MISNLLSLNHSLHMELGSLVCTYQDQDQQWFQQDMLNLQASKHGFHQLRRSCQEHTKCILLHHQAGKLRNLDLYKEHILYQDPTIGHQGRNYRNIQKLHLRKYILVHTNNNDQVLQNIPRKLGRSQRKCLYLRYTVLLGRKYTPCQILLHPQPVLLHLAMPISSHLFRQQEKLYLYSHRQQPESANSCEA